MTDHPAHDFAPAWSPDGRRLAFASLRAGERADLFVVDEDGSNLERLTRNDDLDTEPAWSPDGTWIAFTAARGGNLEVVARRLGTP